MIFGEKIGISGKNRTFAAVLANGLIVQGIERKFPKL